MYIPHLDDKFKCSGIYIFKNNITNKVYIGSSININTRIRHHFTTMKRDLRIGKPLIYFYSALNKYNFDDWTIDILERIDFEDLNNKSKISEVLQEREQFYMDLYQSYNNKRGYNSLKNAYSVRGWHHSEEVKQKMREVHRCRSYSPLSPEHLIRLMEGKNKYNIANGGGYWKGKSRPIETNEKIKNKEKNPVLQIDMKGNVVKKWRSAREAQRESNGYFDHANIGACCNNKSKTHKSFMWIRESDYENHILKDVVSL